MDKEREDRIRKLEALSREGFKCDNRHCEFYEQFHQCYNHSHVLCPQYQEYISDKHSNGCRLYDREEGE